MNRGLQRGWPVCFVLILGWRVEVAARAEDRSCEQSIAGGSRLRAQGHYAEARTPFRSALGKAGAFAEHANVDAFLNVLGPMADAVGPQPRIQAYSTQLRGEIPELAVGIYNYSEAPRATMAQAKEQASEILGRAGIKLRWVDCPVSSPAPKKDSENLRACQQVMDFGGVTLRIIPERMAVGLQLHDSTLGVTIPPDVAVALYQRTQDVAVRLGLSEHEVLGPIIAHELGHLLLGEQRHSVAGIMGQELRAKDFRPVDSRTMLFFTPQQVRIMKARLRDRILLRK